MPPVSAVPIREERVKLWARLCKGSARESKMAAALVWRAPDKSRVYVCWRAGEASSTKFRLEAS